MGRYEFDDFVESVWPVIIIMFVVIALCTCLCFACPCCPWYKRRRQGTVYQNITHPVTRVEITSASNPTGYPITQQAVVNPSTLPYPVQQTPYPTQPAGMVQTSITTYQAPIPNYDPTVPYPAQHPYGQPPPYSEAANAPIPSVPSVPEAYAKQAPFNPNYAQ
ncbi:hypothetical protein J437_LFUL016361 [Ladona fulva]|uniref:Uncharacterized protein n=1 Tax=Ladona fulva TaxID=123851 RepID=A0A8K0KI96_LADFU|nr:hypothetical protein J437_LFUL016361 [Ladona fulva]